MCGEKLMSTCIHALHLGTASSPAFLRIDGGGIFRAHNVQRRLIARRTCRGVAGTRGGSVLSLTPRRRVQYGSAHSRSSDAWPRCEESGVPIHVGIIRTMQPEFCALCEVEAAAWRCAECTLPFCEGCREQTHSTASAQPLSLSLSRAPAQAFCQKRARSLALSLSRFLAPAHPGQS